MFERFTDRARRVIVLAQEEARMLDHNYIGTEHILLGLIHEGEGVAAKVLDAIGISLQQVRVEVEQIIGKGNSTPENHIPFTPRAKKVLELSLREALQLHHNYIGTEHILLGLVREGEGVAAQVLTRLGADLDTIRGEVVLLLRCVTPSDDSRRSVEFIIKGLVAELGPVLRALAPDDAGLAAAMELAVEAVLRRPEGLVMQLLAGLEPPQSATTEEPEPSEEPEPDEPA